MLNLAGPSYDFGNVLFAVLAECEHARRGLLPNEAAARLTETVRGKLATIHESYAELGGTRPYWEELEREVMERALPQYVPAAVEQTRLERCHYDLWRQGDPAARAVFALIGLVLGGLIVKAPFIPIWEDTFAFLLALSGILYPEIKQLYFDRRHTRFLNRLIAKAEKYQKSDSLRYASGAQLDRELAAVGSRLRREEEVADRKLLARVRSTLGHHVSNPRAIEVEVCDGLVTLTGAVLAEELDGMLAAVAAVKGVKGVVNQLVAHECAETLPALASGGSRRRSLPPAARLLAGTAGGVLALAALKQRNPVGAALGSVGLGLLATSGLAGRNLRGLDLGALAAPAQT